MVKTTMSTTRTTGSNKGTWSYSKTCGAGSIRKESGDFFATILMMATCVPPEYDPPTVPMAQLHQGCESIHLAVSFSPAVDQCLSRRTAVACLHHLCLLPPCWR